MSLDRLTFQTQQTLRIRLAADDSKIDGLKKLATVIHQGGSKAILQLVHAGRMTNEYVLKGAPVFATSEVRLHTVKLIYQKR